jgi:UDP-3-O-[3-hydroxymyristoyl] glucosamine N-acyltransferase
MNLISEQVNMKADCIAKLNAIREVIDADVMDSAIEEQRNKLVKLTQLTGLAAEAKAQAHKILSMKELEVMKEFQESKMATSIMSKRVNAECFEEGALLVYADRINSAISHSIEGLRSVISLYKTEMQNSLVS